MHKLTLLLFFFHTVFLSSCAAKDQQDSVSAPEPAIIYEVPEPIYDGINDAQIAKASRVTCDSCEYAGRPYENNKLNYFIANVYEPAMKNPEVSAGNKAFLKKLKYYLECPTDSCGRDEQLIRPVFRLDDDTRMVGIVRYVADNETKWRDTVLKSSEKSSLYRIVSSNSKETRKRKITEFKLFRAACEPYRTYRFWKPDSADTFKPAFATTFDLDLEFVNDKKLDTLLEERMYCRNACMWYCDSETPQVSFAKLKNVPGLYFTTDVDEWGVWFPSRGIFLNIDDKHALELWHFRFELVECSCI